MKPAERAALHDRAAEIFLAAVTLPAGRRDRFVDQTCASDERLAALVRELLDHDDPGDRFLQPLVSSTEPDRGRPSSPTRPGADGEPHAPLGGHPETVGPFRVLAVIGEGGTGTVYRARQDRPARDVALKVLRPELGARLLDRLALEAEVLGQLDHEGIARVYAWGTQSTPQGDRPYLAMELVHGRPLTDFARDEGLGVRDRIALLVKICEAVKHAHGRGVIHRDLKPDNILVTESGQPKILDFGVARATSTLRSAATHREVSTLVTEPGQLVGTLAYMSPEQVTSGLDIDVRSDVYSLGVVAYELLAGRRPHDLAGLPVHEAAQVVTQQSPRPLGELDRALRGDVETIVGCALAIDRTRRYGTAAELAADLRRHLEDRPVLARPPTAWEQARRALRHHPVATVAAGAVVAVLLTALVIQSSARESLREQIRTSRQAERLFAKFMGSRPPGGSDADETLAMLLARADNFLTFNTPSDPAVEGAFRLQLAKVYPTQAGLREEARQQFERGIELLASAHGEDDPRTLAGQVDFVEFLVGDGAYEEGDERLAAVEPTIAAILSPDDETRLAALHHRAAIHVRRLEYEQAYPLLFDGLARARRVFGTGHERFRRPASMLIQILPLERAQPLWEELIEATAHAHGPFSDEVIGVASRWTRRLLLEYRSGGAPGLAEQALDLNRHIAEGMTAKLGLARIEPQLAWFRVSSVLRKLSRYDESEQLLRQVESVISSENPQDWRLTSVRRQLAAVLTERGEWRDAAALYESIIASVESEKGTSPRVVEAMRRGLARCRAELGATDGSAPSVESAR